jgi:hypothetical protein
MSGLVDTKMAVELGKLAGLQYMLLGSVTGFNNETSESFSSSIDSWTRKVRVTLDARVVDVTTGEVVLTLSESRTAEKTNSRYKTKYGVSGSSGYPDSGGVRTEAIESAASRLAARLRSELGEQPYVIAQNGNKVHISLGVNQGVRSGNQYLVYADGAAVRDPFGGTVLDQGKVPIAIIKVSVPQGDFSVCDILDERAGPGSIQPRYKLVSLSDRDARRMRGEWEKARKERAKNPPPKETWVESIGGGNSSSRTPSSPRQSSRPLENQSTDPSKVISTYSLSSGEANVRRIAHVNAQKLSGKRAYDQYVELANSYSGDYLAAYQAGRIAQQLKRNDDARTWYDKALGINPEYKPAQSSRQRLN